MNLITPSVLTLTAVLTLGLLPGFAWLFFYLKEEAPRPEPKKFIVLAFVAGAAFAFLALVLEIFLNAQFDFWHIAQFSLPIVVLFAALEELFKFSAARMSVIHTAAVREPVEVMLYLVIAALGFATVENIGAVTDQLGRTLLASELLQTVTFRFVGATSLHALAAALTGYYWARGLANGRPKRSILLGLGLATGLHVIFNYLILEVGNMAYAVLFLVAIGFLVLKDFNTLRRAPIRIDLA